MGASCSNVLPSVGGLSGLSLRIFLSLPEHFQVVLVLLLQIEYSFYRQPEQLLSVEKRVILFFPSSLFPYSLFC